MPKVLITTVPFGDKDRFPLDMLEKSGIEYLINPLNTKLTEDQLVEMVSDYDVIIAGTEPITEKVMKLEKRYNLSSQLAQELVHNEDFEKYVKTFKISPELIAKSLIEVPKEISKRFNLTTEKINNSSYEEVFKAVENKTINESAILEILTDVAKGNKIDLKKFKKVSTSGIESEIKTMVQANKKLSPNAIMGMVMAKYRGKVDGKKVMEIIKANL